MRKRVVPAYKLRAQQRAFDAKWNAAQRRIEVQVQQMVELQAKTEALRQPDHFTLPAGAVCKRNGIPFELVADAVIRCHPENWPLIRDDFVPEVAYGETFLRSQSEQLPDMPSVAQPGPTSMTSSESLASSCDAHTSRT